MKHIIKFALIVIIAFSIQCTNKSETQKFIPGYISPGDFRPTPMPSATMLPLLRRSYSLFNGSQVCTPGQNCTAVYTLWITEENGITEGIAVNDKALNSTNPILSVKIYRAAVSPSWVVDVIINGAVYSGIMGSEVITITKQADTVTMPAYGPLYPDPYSVQIKTARIDFNQAFNVCNSSGGCISFNASDFIVAQDGTPF